MLTAMAEERGHDGRAVRFWARLLLDTFRNASGERLRRFDPWYRRPVFPHLPDTPPKAPVEMLQDLIREVRYVIRSLLRSPAYASIVVIVLALGIGANTVVFTLVNSLFLSAPPGIADPDNLVRVTRVEEGSVAGSLSYPDFEAFRDRNRTFSSMAAYDPAIVAVTMGRSGSDERQPANAIYVTGRYFEVLGVEPHLGRVFTADEDTAPREAPVVVVSYAFWQTALGADADLVGKSLTLNGHPLEVVGIAPPGFFGSSPMESPPQIWVPAAMEPVIDGRDDAFLIREPNRTITWLFALGRLNPGVTMEQAQADLDGVNSYLVEEFGDWNEGLSTFVTPRFMYQPDEAEELAGLTTMLTGVVLVVLLIVCANIAVLQLARASERQREIGIRAALGASRGAVVRHLLIESTTLAVAGASAGFVATFWLARVAASMLPVTLTAEFTPDLRVFTFSMALAIICAAVFGLAPAVSAARNDVVRSLQSRSIASGTSRLRNGLVVVQVALSLILVTGAALFVRSLMEAQSVDPGFGTEGRVFVSLSPRSHGYGPEETDQLTLDVLRRLEGSAALENASAVSMAPFRGSWSGNFDPDGDDGDDENDVRSYFNAVAPGYFETVGIPLVSGRAFDAGDGRDGDRVIVLNEAAAELMWPGENPLGKVTGAVSGDLSDRVVGVVANSNYRSLGEEPLPIIYASLSQMTPFGLTIIGHSSGSSVAAVQAVTRAIQEVDADLAITRVRTIEETLDSLLGTYRLGARAVGLFALLAAALAAIGLYGVLTYVVTGQTREIGVRLALGATRQGVTGQFVRRGLILAAAGVGLGVMLALAFASSLASMLYRVSPYDPVSFIVVPVLLLGVAGLASLMPALRASQIDPMEALRAD